jgi:hypothetical protein
MSVNTQSSGITYKQKKKLEKDIAKLSTQEHTEILNIIRNNNQKYSENSTGVYFNLKYVNSDTLKKIIEFVQFSKNSSKTDQKKTTQKNKKHKSKSNILGIKFTLNKDEIQGELARIKEKKKENFSFQNFLDKLSVTNIKTFKKNDKIKYPQLKHAKKKFDGVNDRLLRKCRDVNRNDNKFSNNKFLNNNTLVENNTASSNINKILENSLICKIDNDDFSDEDDDCENETISIEDDDTESICEHTNIVKPLLIQNNKYVLCKDCGEKLDI